MFTLVLHLNYTAVQLNIAHDSDVKERKVDPTISVT